MVVLFSAIPDETEKLKEIWRILHYGLPEENFALLKYLMEFLSEVHSLTLSWPLSI